MNKWLDALKAFIYNMICLAKFEYLLHTYVSHLMDMLWKIYFHVNVELYSEIIYILLLVSN